MSKNPVDLHFVYKNQVPNIAVLVTEGAVVASGQSPSLIEIHQPTVIGLSELFYYEISQKDIVIKANSTMTTISRSLLLKELQAEGLQFSQIFDND